MTSRRDELQADAVIAEASAVARANAVLDAQASEIATERLDAVLMLIDVLVASRRILVSDVNWILPAMGYELDFGVSDAPSDQDAEDLAEAEDTDDDE